MRIIISDTCCMIDLRKAKLLREALQLPYTFVMPDTLFEDEWLCLSDAEKKVLRENGLEVRELPGASVQRAQGYLNQHKRLHINDCFALALAEDIQDSILLTGDSRLRRIAEDKQMQVQGVLWITDQLEEHSVVPLMQLHGVLQLLHDDAAVFLPKEELMRRIRRLAKLI